jgi:hypothetical protein
MFERSYFETSLRLSHSDKYEGIPASIWQKKLELSFISESRSMAGKRSLI